MTTSDNPPENDNDNNNDDPLPSEEMRDPFGKSNQTLRSLITKELPKAFLSNPLDIAYLKTTSGDHIITRLIYFSEDVVLLINPCVPQYVPSQSVIMDEKGQERIIKGFQVRFIPYAPFGPKDGTLPMFLHSTDILTRASEYLASEYAKLFPVEESILASYAVEYEKEVEAVKKKETDSSGEKKSVFVLDDGRVIHEISKTVN